MGILEPTDAGGHPSDRATQFDQATHSPSRLAVRLMLLTSAAKPGFRGQRVALVIWAQLCGQGLA
jgi:hypothetical protein